MKSALRDRLLAAHAQAVAACTAAGGDGATPTLEAFADDMLAWGLARFDGAPDDRPVAQLTVRELAAAVGQTDLEALRRSQAQQREQLALYGQRVQALFAELDALCIVAPTPVATVEEAERMFQGLKASLLAGHGTLTARVAIAYIGEAPAHNAAPIKLTGPGGSA